MAHFGDPHVIRYGVPIKIRHVRTGHALHSHNNVYHSGSHQQEVTCFGSRDDNDWWIVKGPHSDNRFNCLIGTPVLNHAEVRLEHVLTQKNLHSHNNHKSPSSHQQEVSCFGELGVGDHLDNWRVEVHDEPEGHPWRIEKHFRLVHVTTHHALHSHTGHHTHTHQQEVTCFNHRDENDLWTIDFNA